MGKLDDVMLYLAVGRLCEYHVYMFANVEPGGREAAQAAKRNATDATRTGRLCPSSITSASASASASPLPPPLTRLYHIIFHFNFTFQPNHSGRANRHDF